MKSTCLKVMSSIFCAVLNQGCWHAIICTKIQEAPLSQMDRATRCVSWNLVNCCTAVRNIWKDCT